jgi:formylglycine-generating enzyme required for sulfatase activity
MMNTPFIFRCIIIAFIFLASNRLVYSESKPGELFSVKSEKTYGLELHFRYCPNGETFDGRPDEEGATAQPIKGFYIQETEMSVGNFVKMTSNEKLDKVKNRLEGSERTNFDDTTPIRGNIIEDITECCEKITAEDTLAQDTTTNIEKRKYRLPTHLEWQYACRAAQNSDEAKKLPHFGIWGEYDSLSDADKADWEDKWKGMNKEVEFIGTQSQVIELVEYYQKIDRGKEVQKILQNFLKAKAGPLSTRQQLDKPDSVRDVNIEPENNWHIKGMHSNVKEWTQEGNDYYLDGGAYNEQVNVTLWKNFTVWGGEKIKDDGNVPGFRLVLSRVPSMYWLLICRQTILVNRDDSKQKDNENHLQDLTTDSDYKEITRKIDIYKTIRKFKDKQINEDQYIDFLHKQLPPDDYNEYFNEIE